MQMVDMRVKIVTGNHLVLVIFHKARIQILDVLGSIYLKSIIQFVKKMVRIASKKKIVKYEEDLIVGITSVFKTKNFPKMSL